MVFFGSISNPFFTLIFFFPNQKHLCPHLHIFSQNICVSQNDKVRRRENETTYLDPEAQTCPALVPVLMLSMLVPLWWRVCMLCPVSCRHTLTRSLCLYDLSTQPVLILVTAPNFLTCNTTTHPTHKRDNYRHLNKITQTR